MKQIALLLLISFAGFTSIAQEVPAFEKKTFTDDEGKIYWQVDLPVYLSISSSIESSDKMQLKEVKSAEMAEHARPMHFDGHGLHFIRHLDYDKNLPENEIGFVMHVDGIAPKSKLTLGGAESYSKNSVVYFGDKLSGSISATDEMSGVEFINQSINGVSFSKYDAELPFSTEGEYVVKYFSVDKVGNAEAANAKNFFVDLTPPVTSIEIMNKHQEQEILSPRSYVKLLSEDALSGVKKIVFKLNTDADKTYASPIYFGYLEDGSHVLNYSSLDQVGNKEQEKSYSFYLDKTPPVVSSNLAGNVFNKGGINYMSSSSTFSLGATDNKAGIHEITYSINSGKELVYSAPVQLPQKQGGYNIKFRAKDQVGNESSFETDENLGKVVLDLTPPALSHGYDGPKIVTRDTLFITEDTKIKLYISDAESGSQKIEYSLNDKDEKTYEEPFTASEQGFHSVSYTGLDNVNNSSNKTFSFVVDNEGPEVFSHLSLEPMGSQNLEGKSEKIPIYPKGTMLYLAATDKLAGTRSIYYRLDETTEQLYSVPIKLLSRGFHSISVRALDLLGNETSLDSIEFVVQ